MDEREFYENLIALVQDNKLLYDKRDRHYYNNQAKQKVWETIGVECKKTDAECKHRWRLLRERYVKEVKKAEQPSGSGQEFREPWSFFEALSFLNDSIVPRRTLDNTATATRDIKEESENFNENFMLDDDSSHSSEKRPKKADVGSLISSLEDTTTSIKNAITELQQPQRRSAIRATLDTIEVLIEDLPRDIQVQFLKKMYMEAMDLRMEADPLS